LVTLTLTMLASVYRSKPIRRGLLLLVALPVAAASVAELSWTEIVVLPGLVAAGAALLFGVNGWSLLGGGAAWVGSQPMGPRTLFAALTWTIVAVIGSATVVTTVGVALFAPGLPRETDVIALVVAAVSCACWVTATALWVSVRRPYQADLRGDRDTPAPPGVMAGYSLRLAGVAGLLGLVMVVFAQLQALGGMVVLSVVVLALAGLRLALARRTWRDDAQRSRVLATISFG
jgi:hypothetical protein